ncbi:MAG: hypothetical protein ACUZ8I_04550 [Candidatus Scalindua sp.]
MGEIDDNAIEFKVGKKIGRKAKVKNATKITAYGLEFDSRLEYNCYNILKESGLKFIFKPEKIVLVPGFMTNVLVHTEENEKKLRKNIRELAPDKDYMKTIVLPAKFYKAECKKDQSREKRLFNVIHKKVIRVKKILPLTWSPDFFLPDYDMYVESKGFANEAFPVKFKIARWELGLGMRVLDMDVMYTAYSAIEVLSKKELIDLIEYLNNS